MTAPTPDPTTASVGEQIAAAIEAVTPYDPTGHPIHDQITGVQMQHIAATIARNFTPTVDGAAVDEAAVLRLISEFEYACRVTSVHGRWHHEQGVTDAEGDYDPCDECHRRQALYDAAYAALVATVPTSPTVTTTGVDDGLREVIENWLIDNGWPNAYDLSHALVSSELRAVLAAHPAPEDPWCREESCRYRHWRSGSMPTHKRGSECPPATLTEGGAE